MRCASCGLENPEGTKFCEECGSKFIQACPGCGREVKPTAKFCGECGAPLTIPVPHGPKEKKSTPTQPPVKNSKRGKAESPKANTRRSPVGCACAAKPWGIPAPSTNLPSAVSAGAL